MSLGVNIQTSIMIKTSRIQNFLEVLFLVKMIILFCFCFVNLKIHLH